jgi:hypothetical protein
MPAKNDPQHAQQSAPASAERGGPSRKRTAMLIVAVLLFEAAAIVGVMVLVAGPPAVDASHMPSSLEVVGDERVVETLILHAKLPNNRTGVTYIYDTEIYVQSAQRYVPRIQRELDQFQNEIRAELTAIWRTAEPHHFQEPNLENLTRRVQALLVGRFGADGAGGEPIIRRCVIVMGTGFRVDS